MSALGTSTIGWANNTSDVTRALDTFCSGECEGKQERYDNCKFSRSYLKEKHENGFEFDGKVNIWEWEPYIIVSAYKVAKVRIVGTKAFASVEYKQLGRSDGKGTVISQIKDNDIVEYKLVFRKNKWWVWDPPLPRIYGNVIRDIYSANLKSYDKDWLERTDISNAQKNHYRSQQNTLKAIEVLLNK